MLMKFTVENLEIYLLVLIRISAFIMAAPIFSYSTIPRNVKVAISFFLTVIVIGFLPATSLEYNGVIGYSVLILKETVAGIVMGYLASVCVYIVNFAGQLIDMEMGFSMASSFDPTTNIQSTISGSFYMYMVMLTMIVTNMHHYLIRAIVDSFRYFSVGEAMIGDNAKNVLLDFMPNFFVIAFRIILPVFASMLIVNIVLGTLSKAAPQMNMFVIGMQLKVIVGLLVMVIMVETIPTVTDFIFSQMKDILTDIIRVFTPT